jgi:hypothetical protein
MKMTWGSGGQREVLRESASSEEHGEKDQNEGGDGADAVDDFLRSVTSVTRRDL